MVRVERTSLVVFSLLFLLVAYSQSAIVSISIETPTPAIPDSSTTPFVPGTEQALASPTPWIAGTETALAASTAEIGDPVVIEKPTDFSHVLYGGKVFETTFFLLLGGVSKETLLAPETSVARFSGEVTYALHSLTQESKYFLWGKAPQFSPTCQAYSVSTEASLDEAGFVGVVDGWAITKRPVGEQTDDENFYRQAVIDWLQAEGLSAPEVDSVRVYRVDIEGDGTEEVFISATHLDGSQHTTKAGDYSIILLRQVVGNDAVTRLVVGDLYRSKELELTFPRTYSLANFIDLNQDGILEVVVDIQKWKGFGARVFQMDGDDVIQTLSAEC